MARILIIEDETDIAELYKMTLEDRGHAVVGPYADPHDALTPPVDTAAEAAPELILLDERLGSFSGTKFAAQFRKRFPKARIIVVSADPDALDWCLSNGIDGIARKPVMLKCLADNIESILARPAV